MLVGLGMIFDLVVTGEEQASRRGRKLLMLNLREPLSVEVATAYGSTAAQSGSPTASIENSWAAKGIRTSGEAVSHQSHVVEPVSGAVVKCQVNRSGFNCPPRHHDAGVASKAILLSR